MRGVVSRRGEQIVFAECLTGLETPLAKGSDYPRFLRQFRSVSGGRAELTADIEGRFKWSADGSAESISIERFVALRAGSGCGPGG